jgi:hypothetical protein
MITGSDVHEHPLTVGEAGELLVAEACDGVAIPGDAHEPTASLGRPADPRRRVRLVKS